MTSSTEPAKHAKTLRSISISTGIIIGLTMADKVFAVIKEMMLAHRFGIAPEMDVFNIAYGFPALLVLLCSGALSLAFVPMYVDFIEAGSLRKARDYSLTVLYSVLGFFLLVFAAGYIFAPYYFPWLGYGFSAEQNLLGVRLIRLLFLLVVVDGGLGAVLAALLQARKGFVSLYVAPMFINLTIIAVLVALGCTDVSCLAWAFIAGTLLKTVYMALALRRDGFTFLSGFSFTSRDLKIFSLLALPLLGSSLIADSSMYIDQVMATNLSAGGVSALRYAFRINELPVQILILAISKALLPYVSEQVSRRDFEGLQYVFKNCIIFIALMSFPTICYVALFSTDIVAILLQRGAFDAEATRLTASTLFCYSLGLFFYSYMFINGTFFAAMKRNKALFYVGILTAVLNVAFNYLFILMFRDVRGIALSTTVTMLLMSLLFMYLLHRMVNITGAWRYVRTALIILGASLALLGLGYLARRQCLAWGLSLYVYFPLLTVLLGAAFAGSMYLFRTRELTECLAALFSRKRR